MKLKVYQNIKELDELASKWFRLAESQGSASLTQYPEIYQSYIAAFNSEKDHFFVAAFFDDNKLVAILPLRMVQIRSRGIIYRVLTFPVLPTSIKEILISLTLNKNDIFKCLSDKFAEQFGSNWDYMHLRGVLETSDLINFTESEFLRCSTKHSGYNHLLDVTHGDYFNDILGKSTRQNLRKKRRKLAALGNWEFRTIDTYPELQEAYQSFLDIEAAGWKSVRGGKRAVKLHGEKIVYFQNLMQRNARLRRCHIHLLYLNDEPIAANYCILTRNICHSLKVGYDEQYSNLSPGNLLQAYIVEYYSELQSIDSIDLISDSKWHLNWKPKCRQVFEVNVFNRTARGVFKYWIRRIKSCMSKETMK